MTEDTKNEIVLDREAVNTLAKVLLRHDLSEGGTPPATEMITQRWTEDKKKYSQKARSILRRLHRRGFTVTKAAAE